MAIRRAALRDTIQIVLRQESGTDDYNNPILVDSDPVTVPAQVTSVHRTGPAAERLGGQDVRFAMFRVIVGPDAVLDGLSKIIWSGADYEVMGDTEPFYSRLGLHHYELNIRRTEGI